MNFKMVRRFVFIVVLMNVALLWAASVKERVRFASGKESAIVKGAVLRGERDQYVVGAKARQTMIVTITSVEDNAVFEIAKPGGGELPGAASGNDATKWRGMLPASGDYVISVGGTRGNATYTLSIVVR